MDWAAQRAPTSPQTPARSPPQPPPSLRMLHEAGGAPACQRAQRHHRRRRRRRSTCQRLRRRRARAIARAEAFPPAHDDHADEPALCACRLPPPPRLRPPRPPPAARRRRRRWWRWTWSARPFATSRWVGWRWTVRTGRRRRASSTPQTPLLLLLLLLLCLCLLLYLLVRRCYWRVRWKSVSVQPWGACRRTPLHTPVISGRCSRTEPRSRQRPPASCVVGGCGQQRDAPCGGERGSGRRARVRGCRCAMRHAAAGRPQLLRGVLRHAHLSRMEPWPTPGSKRRGCSTVRGTTAVRAASARASARCRGGGTRFRCRGWCGVCSAGWHAWPLPLGWREQLPDRAHSKPPGGGRSAPRSARRLAQLTRTGRPRGRARRVRARMPASRHERGSPLTHGIEPLAATHRRTPPVGSEQRRPQRQTRVECGGVAWGEAGASYGCIRAAVRTLQTAVPLCRG